MNPPATWDELQRIIGQCEGAALDFKFKGDAGQDGLECAKDVAAFANALGGLIVFGAKTEANGQRCSQFVGIPKSEGAQLAERFGHGVKEFCRPTPVHHAHLVELPSDPNLVVLVVSILPAALAPVGVATPAPKGEDSRVRQQLPRTYRLVEHSWVFPVRVDSQTDFLQPDQFARFDMNSRRIAALLEGIPANERGALQLRSQRPQRRPPESTSTHRIDWMLLADLVSVRPDQNVVHFKAAGFGEANAERQIAEALLRDLFIPLDWITTVWRDHREPSPRWIVVVDASFAGHESRWDVVRIER